MPVNGWLSVILLAIVPIVIAITVLSCCEKEWQKIATVIVAILIIFGIYKGFMWYYTSTESGQRAMIDQQSNFDGGLERTVTIYTADGEVIAQYKGKIDIEGNDGGYVLFDFEGKRYTYYNCFVESIANIE